MKIVRHLKVPTGDICIVQGEKHLFEMLSLADYGKEKNVKADFMGLERPINGVPHGELMPLNQKWVITISSQSSCAMMCKFCDCPKVGHAVNATFQDLVDQVLMGTYLHPEVTCTKRLNVHYARMGEPTFNWEVINSAIYLAGMFTTKGWGFHPVVSTMMPNMNLNLRDYLYAWMHVKNVVMQGNAGLQISLNTTDEAARDFLFAGNALPLDKIAYYLNHMVVKGRKIALNFALSEYPVDASVLIKYFDPTKFMCKITPMHKTVTAEAANIRTHRGYDEYYPYEQVEKDLKAQGYDVIVFIPSIEEDLGRITCGNAILSGSLPLISYTEVPCTEVET